MQAFFHEVLYRPLFNILAFLYNNIAGEDLGIAIVVLAILVRLVMFPIFQMSFKNNQQMQKVQPELKELQRKYKNDRQKMVEKQMELFQKYEINPLIMFVPIISILFIQLPIILMVNRITRNAYDPDTFPEAYSWVNFPDAFNEVAFGFLNINSAGGSLWISVLLALVIYLNFRLTSQQMQTQSSQQSSDKKSNEPSMGEALQMSMQQMKYVLPIIMFFTSYFILPLALSIYILPTITFLFAQQYLTKRLTGQTSSDVGHPPS